jgi:hypothetical protein
MPEPLREDFSGWRSRRIGDIHRLVYTIESDARAIVCCRHRFDWAAPGRPAAGAGRNHPPILVGATA